MFGQRVQPPTLHHSTLGKCRLQEGQVLTAWFAGVANLSDWRRRGLHCRHDYLLGCQVATLRAFRDASSGMRGALDCKWGWRICVGVGWAILGSSRLQRAILERQRRTLSCLRVLRGPADLPRGVPQRLDPRADVGGVPRRVMPEAEPVPCHHRADLRPQLLSGVVRRGVSLSGCPDTTDSSSMPSTFGTSGAFGLLYDSGASRTKGSNRSVGLRTSAENGSCFRSVTASSGAHRTFTFPANLPIGTDFSRFAGTTPRGTFTEPVSARHRRILCHDPLWTDLSGPRRPIQLPNPGLWRWRQLKPADSEILFEAAPFRSRPVIRNGYSTRCRQTAEHWCRFSGDRRPQGP